MYENNRCMAEMLCIENSYEVQALLSVAARPFVALIDLPLSVIHDPT